MESRAVEPARQADAREVLFDALLDNEHETPWEIARCQLAALDAAGLVVVPREPTKAGTCHACQREVDKVRGSPWHGPHRICEECFAQWYEPDGVDPTSARSVGNATRRKLGLPKLAE